MKKAIIIELVWLAGCLIAAFLLFGLTSGNSALDINLHDTYNSDGSNFSPRGPVVFACFVFISSAVYLVRAILSKFKVVRVTLILLVLIIFLLLYSEYISSSYSNMIQRLIAQNSGTDGTVKGLFYGEDGSVLHIDLVLPWVKIFLIVTFGFTSFITGRNWDRLPTPKK